MGSPRTRTTASGGYGSVIAADGATPPPIRTHSWLYNLLNSKSQSHGSVIFDRSLLLLILANVYVDVMLTVASFDEQHGTPARIFESVSSVFFMGEYVARFVVAGERVKYRGVAGRLRYATSFASIVDLVSFVPWILEKARYGNGDVPSTAYVRAFRVLRILKTDRFTGAANSLSRVFTVNASILSVAGIMAGMLVLFTSTLLFYAGDDAAGFDSIPATMYLSILMLTGQGEPDGELTPLLKLLCAFTAVFSVAMVAIPASMLTFGFEIEAQRLVLKRRERRLRRRLRAETGDSRIQSCSDSEDDDERDLAKARRRKARARAQCREKCFGSAARPERRAVAADFLLSSSEDEYETLVLGEDESALLEKVRKDLAEEAYQQFLRGGEDVAANRDLAQRVREHETRRRTMTTEGGGAPTGLV